MIYIDTSCLLKLFRIEALSGAVEAAVQREPEVVVSSLAELETMVQLKAAWKSGDFSKPQWRRLEAQFASLRNQSPFVFKPLASTLFQTALRQHRNSGNNHYRSLDRLHLAAMEELQLKRLMTHDRQQAEAAAAAGLDVLKPGLV